MQLVQQVKQALRVGLLEPGDQLPKVRDVAQSLAINPNTVLKAYRELEIEGLVEGRPGRGHVRRAARSPAPSLANQAELRDELVAWLRRAQAAGLDQRGRRRAGRDDDARHASTTHGTGGRVNAREDGMDMVWRPTSSASGTGGTWALRDCSLQLPAGRIAALVGPNGAGKSTLLHLAVGLLRPDAGAVRVFGQAPYDNTERAAPTSGSSPRTPRSTATSPRPSWSPWAASSTGAGTRRWPATGWRSSASRRTSRSASSPAGSGPRSRSRWRWPSGRGCCCSTSRSPASTRWPAASSCRR